MSFSRRSFLSASLAGWAVGSSAIYRTARGQVQAINNSVAPALLTRALDALDRHYDKIACRDCMGVIDFSLPSSAPRFHMVSLPEGAVESHLVAHGKGSDPLHTGWLERFSNEPGSNATSAGSYRTADLYVGAHGPSMRLEGLDSTNDNALARALVVHGAWYVSKQMIEHGGVLGRSEGCFAVANTSLPTILTRLSPGHLIYADHA